MITAFYGVQAAGCVVSVIAPPTAISGDDHRDHIRAVVTALAADVLVIDAQHLDYASTVLCEAERRVRLLPLEQLAEACPARRAPDQRALVQFTSGSSRKPRGVVISNAALAANTAAIRTWEQAGPDDVWCSWLPMHHGMGLIGCLVVPVSGNNDLSVCTPETFIRDPRPYLRRLDGRQVAHPATITAMPAFGLQNIVDKTPPEDLQGANFSQIRAVIVGGEHIDPKVLRRFTELLAPHGLDRRALTPAYGLTESTLAVTGVPIDQAPTSVLVKRSDLRVGATISPVTQQAHEGDTDLVEMISCGRPLQGISVCVTDDDGQPVPEGNVGELVVRGTSLSDGYLGATNATFDGDALHTHDAAFEIDGELFVLGRYCDSVNVLAQPVFAEEVELLLTRADLPADRVCAVLGEHDAQPYAYAVLEDLDDHAAKRAAEVLARACPGTRSKVVRLPRGAIPRTTSGKSKRHLLWHHLIEGDPLVASAARTGRHHQQEER